MRYIDIDKMKVYVVHDDTYDQPWGSEETLLGVYSTKEKAQERIKASYKERNIECVFDEDYELCIDEVELDQDVEVYLGGYTE